MDMTVCLKMDYVINDETVDVLMKQALLQAQMGCDVIAPSDMMDGRVGKIKNILIKINIITYKFFLMQSNMLLISMDPSEMQLDQKNL